MKKPLLFIVLFFCTLAVNAQKNEFRIVFSSDIFETDYYDFLPDDKQFSVGVEYSRAIGKRFDIETGLLYSKSGFTSAWCDFCDPWQRPSYQQTTELNGKIGLNWDFIEKEKIGFYTSLGIQGDKKISPIYEPEIPEEDHFSGAAYLDTGVSFKFNRSFSLEFELKGRYNLSDQSKLYYNRQALNFGAGMGFCFSF